MKIVNILLQDIELLLVFSHFVILILKRCSQLNIISFWGPIATLIMLNPCDKWRGASFHVLSWHHMSFVNYLSSHLSIFKNWLFVFLWLTFESYLYLLDATLWLGVWSAMIFSQAIACIFILLMSFAEQEFLILMGPSLKYILYPCCLFTFCINYWERSVKVTNCHCGYFCFSFPFKQILLYVFWSFMFMKFEVMYFSDKHTF